MCICNLSEAFGESTALLLSKFHKLFANLRFSDLGFSFCAWKVNRPIVILGWNGIFSFKILLTFLSM